MSETETYSAEAPPKDEYNVAMAARAKVDEKGAVSKLDVVIPGDPNVAWRLFGELATTMVMQSVALRRPPEEDQGRIVVAPSMPDPRFDPSRRGRR